MAGRQPMMPPRMLHPERILPLELRVIHGERLIAQLANVLMADCGGWQWLTRPNTQAREAESVVYATLALNGCPLTTSDMCAAAWVVLPDRPEWGLVWAASAAALGAMLKRLEKAERVVCVPALPGCQRHLWWINWAVTPL